MATDAQGRDSSSPGSRLQLRARGPAATSWAPMDLPAAEGCRKIIEDLEASIEQFQFSSRLTVSDDLKIGFFSTDRATQTEISEIVSIKELTSSTRSLVEIVKSLQVDFTFLKQLLQLQFEDRLKEESSRLFSIFSDRIQSLERALYQNEEVIRMCYHQQLSDAIAVIKAMYKKYFEKEEEEKIVEKDSLYLKITTLIKRLKEKEGLIQELREEIERYEDSTFQKYDSYFRDPTGSIKQMLFEKDFWECKEDVEKLNHKVADLQEELGASIKENAHLEYEIMNLKERAEKDQLSIQKLIEGREKLVNELENEKLLVHGLTLKYKDELEARRKLDSIALKLKLIRELTIQEEKKAPDQRALERQIELLKSNLETEKKKAERYKRESERISKIWEKKFLVLRNSLHALKNEMFTRHTLYRQFAVVADTSFNYAKVKPLYVQQRSSLGESDSSSDYHYYSMDSKYNTLSNEQQSFPNSPNVTTKTVVDNAEKPLNPPKSDETAILNAEKQRNPQNTPAYDFEDHYDDHAYDVM